MKVVVLAIAGTSAVAFLYYFLAIHLGLASFLARRGGDLAGRATWTDRGPTPLGEEGYTPQGLTWVDGTLIFANTWKDARSRVYEIDPGSMSIRRHFDMPDEAVHTSGLAWDGDHLWAVDYISNRAYRIDLEPSLSEGRVRLVGSFATTLRGTSACCIVPWEGGRCLAVSDYMRSRRTVFIRTDDALRAGTAAGAIAFSYRNEGFSQGLEFVGGFLYESENKRGVDVINKMDMARLRESRSAREATVRQYPAPSAGVEDLAWDGASLWTGDESVFRFFKGTLDD
jgi:glutamine cyclotransferase